MTRVLLISLIALISGPAMAAGQARDCFIDAPGRTEQLVETGDTLVILHDPFEVTCTDGAELRADRGRLNRGERVIHLVGNVFFQDQVQTLTSNEATYHAATAMLLAEGDVVFVNREEGSTLEGPELEYFRATEERPVSRVNASQRPHLVLQPSEGEPDAEPLDLVADRVEIVDQRDLSAFGNVVITRSDMNATAGEASYNASTEDLELRQRAVIRSAEYELAGEVVQARLAESSIEHVRARTDAWLQGEDLRVEAPDLQLFFAGDLLERAIAVAPPGSTEQRATAISRTFRMEGDSLDAAFVEQQLQLVHAVGSALGETIDTLTQDSALPLAASSRDTVAEDAISDLTGQPDSIPADTAVAAVRLAHVPSSDWIRGDTITGYFERVIADTVPNEVGEAAANEEEEEEETEEQPQVELRRLVARGSAQSLYRMTPQERQGDSTSRKNLNFLVGDQIELDLQDGELHVASVEGLRQGVYLEAADLPANDVDDTEALDPDSVQSGAGRMAEGAPLRLGVR